MLTAGTASEAYFAARNFLFQNLSDYERAYAGFQWPRVETFNWATDYFDLIARGNHKPALWFSGPDGDTRYSFDELYRRSNQVAQYFSELGLQPSDPVMLMLPNRVELWESMLAAIKSAAVMVPTSTLMPKSDIEYRIRTAGVKCVITTTQEADKFDGIPGIIKIIVGDTLPGWVSYHQSTFCAESYHPSFRTRAEHDLFMFFTSGTTSNPKCVRHTHASYPIGHLSTAYALSLVPGDVHLNIAQAGWAKHAWSSFFAPWIAEACVFSYAYPDFNVEQLLRTLNDFPITSFCAPPTVWRRMREYDNLSSLRPPHLRQMFSVGEPLNPEVMSHLKAGWNLTIRQVYGQTETTALIGQGPAQDMPFGALGYPMPGYRVSLLDETTENSIRKGELIVERTNTPVGLTPGYLDAVTTENVMKTGYYRTSDRFKMSPEGLLTFESREDDLFKTSGYLISPTQLESLLIRHESVLEAAVVPSPDHKLTALPKAFIVLKTGHTPDLTLATDILKAANHDLAPSHRIRIVQFCTTLPKTNSGKILRRQLKDEEARGLYQNDALVFMPGSG